MPTVKEANYNLLGRQLASLIKNGTNLIAISSNTSALLNDNLDQINWLEFYLIENNELILSPFQGHPVCIHTSTEKGVCGTAVANGQTQLVDDIDTFPDHIACDTNSKSGTIVPIHVNNEIIGVLDVDIPITQRFSKDDQQGLGKIVSVLEHRLSK